MSNKMIEEEVKEFTRKQVKNFEKKQRISTSLLILEQLDKNTEFSWSLCSRKS